MAGRNATPTIANSARKAVTTANNWGPRESLVSLMIAPGLASQARAVSVVQIEGSSEAPDTRPRRGPVVQSLNVRQTILRLSGTPAITSAGNSG